MKCPQCHHVSGDTALLKCDHCGAAFERGPLEELQHIDYLQEWLNAHRAQLGQAGESLHAEIQVQRSKLEDRLGVRKVDVAKASRELALLQANYERMPAWMNSVSMSSTTVRLIRTFLQQRMQQLSNLLGQQRQKVVPTELEILEFALQTLPTWEKTGGFNLSEFKLLDSQSDTRKLCDVIEREHRRCLVGLARKQALQKAILGFMPVWEKQSALDVTFSTELTGLLCTSAEETRVMLAGRQIPVVLPNRLEAIDYAIHSLPGWANSLGHTEDDVEVQKLLTYLLAEQEIEKHPVAVSRPAAAQVAERPVAAQAAAQIPAAPVVAQPPSVQVAAQPPRVVTSARPVPPPKPARPPRPPINWGRLWEKTVEAAVSGALLRGLLYLGAFMIVVSLTILVMRFWNIFPTVVQAVFIFSVPTAFYAAGWVVRARLKLPQAGNVLSGVGALLVAVDLAAIYQLAELPVSLEIYWLVGSLVCTLIYGLTAWRLKGIFFDYVTLIGGVSVLVALTRFLHLPLEWSIVAVMAGSGLMVFATTRLWGAGDSWRDMARATRYLPQLLIPAGLVAILFFPGNPAVGRAAAFLVASLSYVLLAWRFPGAIFTHAAVWCSVGAAGFSLRAAALPDTWYGTAASLLAVPYTLVTRWMGGRIPPDLPARKRMLLAPNLAGFVLLLGAILLGSVTLFFDYWAGVMALGLAALVLAFWSYWFHRPVLVILAAGTFCAPFCLAVGRLLVDARVNQWVDWMLAALTGLALAYLGLAILLRRAVKYAAGLHLWVQLLPPITGFGLIYAYSAQVHGWDNLPALAALGCALLVYLVSAILHDSDRHPGLSGYVSSLVPGVFGQAIFIWVSALLLPVWISIAWYGSILVPEWLGAALAGLSLVYLGIGQLLVRHKLAYRLPMHATALLLAVPGIWAAVGDEYALMTSLYLGVALLAGISVLYHSRLAVAAAVALFILPFQITLDVLTILPHAQSVVYALLACFGYLPLGMALDRLGRKYSLPVYIVGYSLSVYALFASGIGRFGVYGANLLWVGVLTPAIVLGLYIFSLYRFRWSVFAWAAAVTTLVFYGQLLTLLQVPAVYDAACWAGLAYLYMCASWGLSRSRPTWMDLLRDPLGAGAAVLGFSALALTMNTTLEAFYNDPTAARLPATLFAQALVAGLAILASVLYRSRWPLYLAPWLAFLPATLFFIGYDTRLFGPRLEPTQVGLVWSGLGVINLLAAAVLDPLRERYAHGLYLGGYALALLAVLWSLASPPVLVWTFGILVLICAVSALGVHTGRHKTWNEVMTALFGKSTAVACQVFHDAFLWLAAWLFPAWCALLLRQLHLVAGYEWLGFSLPALAYIGLSLALAHLQRAYAWPFNTAGQAYTALAVLLSAPVTLNWLGSSHDVTLEGQLAVLAVMLTQTCAVLYYTLSAALYRRRLFAYLAVFLVFFPYTLGWVTFGNLSTAQISLPWMGLATLLLAAGYLLDRRPERYSHAMYLGGYLLAALALVWCVPDRAASLYVLGWSILAALVSQILVHFGRHASYDDLTGLLLGGQPPASTLSRVARIPFLFFAVYAFPVWLALLLGYRQVSLASVGLALAVVAPLYLAAGLVLRRVKGEYTWPVYSAAYALTVIGAVVSLDDLRLVTWVLALDAVMYAASAYIFRQSFWLYLSNTLAPVIALFTLILYDRLEYPWIAGIFIGLAYLYFVIGNWFDGRSYRPASGQRRAGHHISPYALPFYLPGYLLSVISLLVAISERNLAIIVYLAGVVLYALSAWVFQQSLFLYPAAWLAAVPYGLLLILTSLPAAWFGLGWLPLIVVYILLGRFALHKRPLVLRRALWAHPAMPFYLLAYGMSIGMMILSALSPAVLTVAFTAAAVVYFGSAALFRRPAWLYPALLAAHLALLSYFTIQPSDNPAAYISLPFSGVTWVIALAGYLFSRVKPAARRIAEGKLVFKLWQRELDFGALPSIGWLATPSWAQPFFIFTALDVLLWQLVALFSVDMAIVVAVSTAVLLGLFATLWLDAGLVCASLAFGLLASAIRLQWAQVTPAGMLAWLGGLGLGLYLFGRLLEITLQLRQPKTSRLEVWLRPLFYLPVGMTSVAVVGMLPLLLSETAAAAASLAFAGALYLAIAYRGRYYRLGYLAVGMLEAAWVLVLVMRQVQQPQLYAIPAGLYFLLIGYLESRRSHRLYAQLLESFGLAILLVTSFVQSLNDAQGFLYFVLLLVEGVLVMWWGAARRQKIPFFAGMGASALNVVAQVVVLVNVYDVNRWFIILGVGLVLVILAVFVERRRERLLTRAQAWRDALASWS